jgi:hypothetical protein
MAALNQPSASPASLAHPEATSSGAAAYLDLLREEIQALGRGTRLVRIGLNAGAVVMTIAAAPALTGVVRAIFPYLMVTLGLRLGSPEMLDAHYRLTAAVTLAAGFLGYGAATGLLAGYRRLRQGQFARKLARFSAAEQDRVLQGLESDLLSDTRALAASLRREVGERGTELSAVSDPGSLSVHAVVPAREAERADGWLEGDSRA